MIVKNIMVLVVDQAYYIAKWYKEKKTVRNEIEDEKKL